MTGDDSKFDADAGTHEQICATNDLLNIPLAEFAEAYPSAVAIAAVVRGQVNDSVDVAIRCD